MSKTAHVSGFADINNARIYYEVAGEGRPFVMIHAGVADSRQWHNEFEYFANRYRAIRYDTRGFGLSEPVDGEFSFLRDLMALLDYLDIHEPVILMGCSMGGGLAMDFALAQPERVAALIMVCSAPSGLDLDVPDPPGFEEAERAYNAGDLDLTAEIETQIWFDGVGRTPVQVNQAMRQLAFEMNRKALEHATRQLGTRLPDAQAPAAERLGELTAPTLIIVGAHDIPYMHAAASFMAERIPSARKAIIEDAAHLANMDQPAVFQRQVVGFLAGLAA